MNGMSRKKKSGFLTFCFSLLPGAGEMYLGFMKMGVSLMGLFFALCALSAVLNMPSVIFGMVVEWFYSFFHVHNLAGLSDEEFLNVKDEFLFNLDTFFNLDKKAVEKHRQAIAIILIVVGALFLRNGIKDAIFIYLPEVVWRLISRMEHTIPKIVAGIAIIAGGCYMIRGKKEELKEVIVDVDGTVKDADSVMRGSEAESGNADGTVIYGMDMTAGSVPERSGYGEEQEH